MLQTLILTITGPTGSGKGVIINTIVLPALKAAGYECELSASLDYTIFIKPKGR